MSQPQTNIYTFDFSDGDHPAKLLDAFRDFYIRGVFTDISLQSGDTGQLFHCHKVLLSACSSYFRVMFTTDMRERSDRVVTLSTVSTHVLESLLDFIYTSRICITKMNVQSLLEAADHLQFLSVKQACEDFLIQFLDVDNCLGMHAFAQQHVCRELEKEALRVMLMLFTELCQQEEFSELSEDRLRPLLASVSCTAIKDELLIDAVARWAAHDWDRRVCLVSDLLHESISLELDELDFKALVEEPNEYLIKNQETLKCIISKTSGSGCMRRSAHVTLSSNMYIIGGYYWNPLNQVHIWNPISKTWRQGKDMPEHARESYGVTILGPNIYVTGGYQTNTVEALDSVWIYNCDRDDWTEGCPMITARYYHCSVALNGCIYAIGGYRGGAPEQETEFYDPLQKKWSPVAKIIQGVGNATACVVRDRIYVTGGHYGYRGTCTYEKIQMYKADINEWSIITTSPHPEYGLASVSLNNKLYLVGGQTTMADCYDTERDEWKQISGMKERRMECGAVVINGCIHVTGGYSYSKGTYLESIEKYDPELDTWQIIGALPSPTRSHGCVCFHSVS
ncbi:kelch-like protein 23 [Gouania willdenowi]|uniref:BTB domain-containing protein n=1 Tax=Gouania willdenowi TaxID=441366 RepID=A0A8C5DMR5_GOUWI|nr:kelch-like protein 23 [Gouania willdenowi]